MHNSVVRQSPRKTHRAVRSWLAPLLLVIGGALAYSGTLDNPFIFDSESYILDTARLRDLGAIGEVLSGRRPVVDLTLAINHAIGGADPRGYHLFNTAVHILAALTLFGLVRRTMMHMPTPPANAAADGMAFAAALIWMLHPLQTQSVSYVIQRAESLMGLFYLLTLYCFVRGVDGARPVAWYVVAILCCALGMGSKAVMISAPLVVLLYDRTFVAGTFRSAWTKRWAVYGGLVVTWGVLWLCGVVPTVLDPSPKGRVTVGLGYAGASPLAYAMTQPGVLLYYLRLSIWPHPLCLDYAWPLASDASDVVLPAIGITVLLAAVVWALWRDAWIGFVGVWFFAILAPTSSFIPVRDPLFEHRMYLPLAAISVLLVAAGRFALDRLHTRGVISAVAQGWTAIVLVAVVALALGMTTFRRNEAYQSKLVMWQDVVSERPANARAHANLGNALATAGNFKAAAEHCRKALALDPSQPDAPSTLGYALLHLGRLQEAVDVLQRAVQANPSHLGAQINLGTALVRAGRLSEAIEPFEAAERLRPDKIVPRRNLASIYLQTGRLQEAAEQWRALLRVAPDLADAHAGLGDTYALMGRIDEAVPAYQRAAELDPSDEMTRRKLQAALRERGRPRGE